MLFRSNLRDATVTEERYMAIIHAKTAALFEAAAMLGAVIANASETDIAAAATYGRQFGMAFQLIDDVLDYSGNPADIGKNLGDDLREGKMTLPLIRLIQTGSAAQRRLVQQCIENGNGDQFPAILEALATTDGLSYTRQAAEKAAQAAAEAIATLPYSQFKETLLELSAFAAGRNH